MNVVIMGAGGVGGYYGGMLARAGHEVFFIARGASLARMKSDGLAVKSFKGDFHVTAARGERSDSFGVADLVLVCVKSYDTAGSFDLFRKSVGVDTVLVSLQNGIDNEELLADEFGREKVMGGVAFIGSRVEAPGVILHTAFGHITIGDLDGGVSERAQRIGGMFNAAGVKCRVSDDIRRDLWRKMIWNVGFNALCAALDRPAKEAVAFDDTRWIVKTAMLEWIAVARASGVDLDPGLADKNIDVTLEGGEVIPSLLHDKRRGQRMEIEAINGKVVALGEALGIGTPVNRTLAGIVRFYNETL